MTIEEIIEKAEKESNKNLVNLTKTIAYAAQETYVKAMNDIYKQVGTGKADHFTAYKKTVDELTKKGITLKTKDKRQEKLEVAVRRGLFGSLHQTANEISKKVGEDIDYNCVVIGHSYTCRPSHNVIDDVVMSKDEFAKYEHLTEEYGCNHIVNYDWREEFEGINNKKEYGPEHMSKKECKENYEVQQKARYYERMIREKKNVTNRGDTSDKAKQELKLAQIKYRTYCNSNGLKVDYKRTWKSKYNKSSIKNKITYKDITHGWKSNRIDKGSIDDAKYVILKNKKYFVNDRNKINHKNNEVIIAELLVKNFGGELKYLPEIGEDDNVRCGDFFYKNEVWDAKELGKNAISEKRAVDNLLKESKGQANNFILDITNSLLKTDNILQQVQNLYSTNGRDWIDKIIVINNEKILKVYQRQKK